MFYEADINPANRTGWIEVIAGSMFSGKTEELIRRLKRARLANQHVEIFKPEVDNRYAAGHIVSHDDNAIRSTPVQNSANILLLLDKAQVVGIDEAQFFDAGIVEVCNMLARRGIRVIVAGLDMDFKGRPFGPMPALMACSEYVTKLRAICMRCGNPAQYSHRIVENDRQVLIGEKDSYEPLCRKCYSEIYP